MAVGIRATSTIGYLASCILEAKSRIGSDDLCLFCQHLRDGTERCVGATSLYNQWSLMYYLAFWMFLSRDEQMSWPNIMFPWKGMNESWAPCRESNDSTKSPSIQNKGFLIMTRSGSYINLFWALVLLVVEGPWLILWRSIKQHPIWMICPSNCFGLRCVFHVFPLWWLVEGWIRYVRSPTALKECLAQINL